MKKINKYKNYLLGVIGILIALTMFVGVKYLLKPKYEELPEVKLKEIKDSKSFAIMVQNGDSYEEYKSEDNTWPGTDYVFKEAKCTDNNGTLVENAITFENDKATLETDKTIYCTLYFDEKYNYMLVPLHNVPAKQGTVDIPVYMSEKIKQVEFVNYIKNNLNDSAKGVSWWDISDTTQGTKEESVVAWTEPIVNDTGYNKLYIGSAKKIRALSIKSMFAAGGYYKAIESNIESINFGNQLDTSKTTSFRNLFTFNEKLTTITGMENWDTSMVTDMGIVFYHCIGLNDFSTLSKWIVSNVTDMYAMFAISSLSNLEPLSEWKLGGGSLREMFYSTKITDTTPINNWNVSSVTNFWGVFSKCSNLKTANLSNWDTSNATNIKNLFLYASNLETIDLSKATFTQIKEEENYINMFLEVPTTATLLVKDNNQKQWIEKYQTFSGNINVAN